MYVHFFNGQHFGAMLLDKTFDPGSQRKDSGLRRYPGVESDDTHVDRSYPCVVAFDDRKAGDAGPGVYS